jgi:hypothetical protein
MEISMYLARLFGVYFLVIAFLMMMRKKECKESFKSFFENHGAILLSGALSLFGGLAILVSHRVLTLDIRGIITVLAIFMVLKGILRIGYPEIVSRWARAMLERRWALIVVILLILGIYMTMQGFGMLA